jgi:ribonuclease BN (tRNA processing enzyme)
MAIARRRAHGARMHSGRMLPVSSPGTDGVTVTFAGSGDAFGSGGRNQACIHLRGPDGAPPVLLDCGATSLSALRRHALGLGDVAAIFISHLHGDHFGGVPFMILNEQFARRVEPLSVIGPAGTARRLAELMECMFPGSSAVARRFDVLVTELRPGEEAAAAGVRATAFAADHPSGPDGPALALRLTTGGKVIGYTGDTAWTDALIDVAAGADLLIAEAYHWDKVVPYHLSHADLAARAGLLTSRRTVLTHMSADMLQHADEARFETAGDGFVLRI